MEPQYSEWPRDWQKCALYKELLYIKVLSCIFYYQWGRENHSSYRGLRYIEVHYIEFPLYLIQWRLIWVLGNCPLGSYCLLFTPKQIIAVGFACPIANDQLPKQPLLNKVYIAVYFQSQGHFFGGEFYCSWPLFSEIAFAHRRFCRGSVALESSAYSWVNL